MRRKHWPRHGGLGLGLGVGGGGVGYLLNDSFTNDVAAGAFAGANLLAVPGPGTRVLVDADSDVIITTGKLTRAYATVTTASRLWLDAITQDCGRIVLTSFQNVCRYHRFGFDTDQTGTPTNPSIITSISTINIDITGTQQAILAFAPNENYFFAHIIGGTTGANKYLYTFAKGGTTYPLANWTLVYIGYIAPTMVYPIVQLFHSFTASYDFIRVPTMLWTPQPLSADAFGGTWPTTDGGGLTGLEAGGSGKTWTTAVGATWSNALGFAVNAPVAVELLADPGLEATYTGGLCDSLTKIGAPTVVESADVHGGSKAQSFAAAAQNNYLKYSFVSSPGVWYRCTVWAKRDAGTQTGYMCINFLAANSTLLRNAAESGIIVSGTYTEYRCIHRSAGIADYLAVITDGNAVPDSTFIVDDVSVKSLTTAELIQVINNGVEDFYAEVDITAVKQFHAGIVFNYTDASNFEVIYLNRIDAKIYWDKVTTALGWVNMSNTAFTYAAAAKLAVRKIGTAVYIWYNNAYVHNNTSTSGLTGEKQGLFSTGNGATEVKFANWKLYAVGSGGEYSLLDMFCN